MKRVHDSLITGAAVAAALSGPTAFAAWLGRSTHPLPPLPPAIVIQATAQATSSIDGATLRETVQMGLLVGRGKVVVNNGIDGWQSIGTTPLSYAGGELIRVGSDGIGVLRLPSQGTVFLCPNSLSVMTRGNSGQLNFGLSEGTARLIFETEDAPRIEAAQKEFLPDHDEGEDVWAAEMNVKAKEANIMMLKARMNPGVDIPTKYNDGPWDGADATRKQFWVVSPSSDASGYDAQVYGYPADVSQPQVDTVVSPDRAETGDYLCRLPEIIERAKVLTLTDVGPGSAIPTEPPQELPNEGLLGVPPGNPPLALAEPVKTSEAEIFESLNPPGDQSTDPVIQVPTSALPGRGTGGGASDPAITTASPN